MITIDQLLESVDLDFEPRWVTKDKDDSIYIWDRKPVIMMDDWLAKEATAEYVQLKHLKLAEFENKNWQECIYEVPRKTTMKIEKLKEVSIIRDGDFPSIESTVKVLNRIINRLNDVIDAVNELKGV